MKNKIIIKVTSLVLAALLFSTCEKTPMEKAQDAYNASMVIPAVLSVTGPALALQTFAYDFQVGYYRAGSTWNWSAVDATVQSVSSDTRKATILFNALPASGKAQVKVTETTAGGTTSPEKIVEVTVDPFCPLAPSGFTGDWSGTDGAGTAMYPAQVVISDATSTTVKVTGLNVGWMEDAWGEIILEQEGVTMTIVENGNVTIAEQYIFTTEWEGDPYEYGIKGTGNWGNCGDHPTLTISYNIYYLSDNYTLPSATTKFTATLVLDGGKGFAGASAVKSAGPKADLKSLKRR